MGIFLKIKLDIITTLSAYTYLAQVVVVSDLLHHRFFRNSES